ncbi:hypothetical protein [Pseudotenacibaculum haliotis]|uniref:Copper chaperone n=1 Tax=Pseudotenacibaculum haliotis TaxID=1862138 RepID=A0ABW5LQI8_9FLAO
MKLLILRTNIKTQSHVDHVKVLLNNLPAVNRWSVDTEDIDNVLRIEAKDQANELELMHLIRTQGYICEDLPDCLPTERITLV